MTEQDMTNKIPSGINLIKKPHSLGSATASIFILFFLGSIFAACTDSSGGGGGASMNPGGSTDTVLWTQDDIDSERTSCIDGNTSAFGSKAATWCLCIIETASKRWSHEDFIKTPIGKFETLAKDGTGARCNALAGFGQWSTSDILTARNNCVDSAVAVNPLLANKRDNVGISCGCLLEDASKRWAYDDYLKNQYSYSQQQMNDGTVKRCLEFAGLIPNQNTGSGGTAPSPLAVITGKPSDPSRDSQLNIQVTGSGIEKYKFKLGLMAVTDCSQSSGYSTERMSSTPITNSLANMLNQFIRICVVGKSGDVWQSYTSATEYEWLNDNLAPTTPGTPNFTILSGNSISVSWSPSLYGEPAGYLVIRRSGTSAPTAPDAGASYNVGAATSGDSLVVYKGVGTNFTDTTATSGAIYSYSVFSYDSLLNYSSPATANFLFRSWGSQAQISNLFAVSGYDADIDSSGRVMIVTADKSVSYSSSTGWSAPINGPLGSSPKFRFSNNGVGFGVGSSGAAKFVSNTGWDLVKSLDPGISGTSCDYSKTLAVNGLNNAVFTTVCLTPHYPACTRLPCSYYPDYYLYDAYRSSYIDGQWTGVPTRIIGSEQYIAVWSTAMGPDNMTRVIYSTGYISAPNLKYFDMDPSGQSIRTPLSGTLYSSSDGMVSGAVLADSSLGFQSIFGALLSGSRTTKSLFTESPFGQLSVSDSAYNYWGTRPIAFMGTANRFYFVSIEPDTNSTTKVVLRSTIAGTGIWSSEKVFSARNKASYPSVSVSGSGHLALAWLEGNSNQDIVSAVYYPDFGWSGPNVIDSYNDSAQAPVPLVSSSGEVSVIWSQFTSSMLFQAQFK
jgi:hypothetical protein